MTKRSAKENYGSDDETIRDLDVYFPPEKLYEYQWPLGDPCADFFFLQEHVAEYLGINGIRSFQRKYPDMERRILSMEEREFLVDEGVISEEQSTLGLAALKSDDVCQLMMEEYPSLHQKYLKVFNQRETERAIQQKVKERDAVIASSADTKGERGDSVKVQQAWKRAHRQVAEFNAKLNRERKDQRRCFYDVQTNIVQHPQNKVESQQLETIKVGLYPVALIPGQFQDYYVRYTPQQLAMFPLKTPTAPPPTFLVPTISRPHYQFHTEINKSRVRLGTTAGARRKASQGRQKDGFYSSAKRRKLQSGKEKSQDSMEPCTLCGICLEGKEKNKLGEPEELISCCSCGNSGHPSCLDMSKELVAVIKTYPWQCIECKTCMLCNDPHDDDKMLFCDECDRGYHTFCVGLTRLPTGQWVCDNCPKKLHKL
ncbi:PHD finger protein 10-like [Corticium candelabrum]|uniref:PHD finger protein 10-like n=1 Tax=Corticium candelabrum TaxID=121492 RepID=UPI002E33F546|nr:PHD finger protein 10-like [Corticium candelabrum]